MVTLKLDPALWKRLWDAVPKAGWTGHTTTCLDKHFKPLKRGANTTAATWLVIDSAHEQVVFLLASGKLIAECFEDGG